MAPRTQDDNQTPARHRHIPAPEGSGVVQHAAWLAGTFPEVEDLGGGTFSIPVPFPDNPLRYTLSYLLVGEGAAIVIDPGWDSDEGADALFAGLTTCGVDPGRVDGVLVTHVHPDHHGLTNRLVARSGCWIGMHAVDDALLAAREAPGRADTDQDWLRRNGVPDDTRTELALVGRQASQFMAMPAATRLFADGEVLPLPGRQVRAVWTPGHTPGHLCLHDEQADRLFTGDHLLPRISPNIGTHSDDGEPPLAQYLDSLRKLAGYDSAEALPAHEWRFRGIAARTAELIEHHRERGDEIVRVLGEGPLSAWETATRLTWSRGWSGIGGMMRRAALAETISHLVYLADSGAIRSVPSDTDPVVRYRPR